jgi:hypothetical protein
MSYYYSLTTEQLVERKNEFNRVFESADGYYNLIKGINAADLSTKHLTLISDYIGYLTYRSFRMMRKYQDKEKNIVDYLNQYRKADYAIASFIHEIGMDSIKTVNPLAHRIMTRFLNTESL